jgi:hypothetical protein
MPYRNYLLGRSTFPGTLDKLGEYGSAVFLMLGQGESRYPANWREIALAIKKQEGWHCYRCGVRCQRMGDRLVSARQRAFLMQVHHWDCDPQNNGAENLAALCTVCHLHMHRGQRGSVLPGQGVLPLKVESCLPPRAGWRMPIVVQLGLWGVRERQLELWRDSLEFQLAFGVTNT